MYWVLGLCNWIEFHIKLDCVFEISHDLNYVIWITIRLASVVSSPLSLSLARCWCAAAEEDGGTDCINGLSTTSSAASSSASLPRTTSTTSSSCGARAGRRSRRHPWPRGSAFYSEVPRLQQRLHAARAGGTWVGHWSRLQAARRVGADVGDARAG